MFKQLKIYYLFISFPFVFLLTGATIFFDAIKLTITRNPHPQINYTIFAIILIGGCLVLLNARRLLREAKTVAEFSNAVHAKVDLTTLQEIAGKYTGETSCLLQLIAASGERSISHQEQVAIEHELANTRASILRRNALPSYLTGLLVGMGLLGTFIGLLATLHDITVLITSFADLDMQNASPLLVFRTMIERMKAPMNSMGIAFSASMFGLLGSIILGLMMVGIRRLQGDMFSVLSSEIARHIEGALSHRGATLDNQEIASGDAASGDVDRVLFRIEERYAEAARSQQRALSAVIDDMQKQRADMLRVLTEQTEASNSFRGELQQLGRQFGSLFSVMEKGRGELSTQVSELTVHLAGDAKETHKLLTLQVDEQKLLRDTLDSYNLEERLAETARAQQRALTSAIDDLQEQRAEMLRALTEQTQSNNNSRGELQFLGGQLENILKVIERGNNEMSTQLSELTVHMAADAKESHLRLDNTSNNFRDNLQQLGSRLGSFMEKANSELCTQVSELAVHVAADAKESHLRLDNTNNNFRDNLQQLGSQLGSFMEKTNRELCTQISELAVHVAADAKESQNLLTMQVTEQKGLMETLDSYKTEQAEAGNNARGALQQLGSQLGDIFNVMEKGNSEICMQISELVSHMNGDAKESYRRFDNTSNDFRGELKHLGVQLGNILSVMEKGNSELCTQIAELMARIAGEEEEAHEPHATPESEPMG